LTVVRDEASGRDLVMNDSADAEVSMLAPEAYSKFQASGRVELSEYISGVRASMSVNARQSDEFARSHYASTPIVTRPVEYGDGSGRLSFESQVALSPIPARWFEADDGRPITFFINPIGAPNPQVVDDVTAAIDTW